MLLFLLCMLDIVRTPRCVAALDNMKYSAGFTWGQLKHGSAALNQWLILTNSKNLLLS